MNPRILSMTTIGALVASMLLVGCTKTEQQNAKISASEAAATAEQKAKEAARDAAAALEKAKVATVNAAEKVGDKIDDAVITSSVKTELAKDPNLSALAIDVDTSNGRVALKGTAPTPTAKEHASTLAQNVKGVVSVDNQLTIKQ